MEEQEEELFLHFPWAFFPFCCFLPAFPFLLKLSLFSPISNLYIINYILFSFFFFFPALCIILIIIAKSPKWAPFLPCRVRLFGEVSVMSDLQKHWRDGVMEQSMKVYYPEVMRNLCVILLPWKPSSLPRTVLLRRCQVSWRWFSSTSHALADCWAECNGSWK